MFLHPNITSSCLFKCLLSVLALTSTQCDLIMILEASILLISFNISFNVTVTARGFDSSLLFSYDILKKHEDVNLRIYVRSHCTYTTLSRISMSVARGAELSLLSNQVNIGE